MPPRTERHPFEEFMETAFNAQYSGSIQASEKRLDATPVRSKISVHVDNFPFLEFGIHEPKRLQSSNESSLDSGYCYDFSADIDRFVRLHCIRRVNGQAYFKRFPTYVRSQKYSDISDPEASSIMQPHKDLFYSSEDAYFMDPIPSENLYPPAPINCRQATNAEVPRQCFAKRPLLVTYDPELGEKNTQPTLNNIGTFEMLEGSPHPHIAKYYGAALGTLPCFVCSGQDNYIRDARKAASVCSTCLFNTGNCDKHPWNLEYAAMLRCRCYDKTPRVLFIVLAYYPFTLKHRWSLDVRSSTQPWEPAKRASIVQQICTAVQHIWNLGYCINNLSPDTIMMTEDDEPVIADFGECLKVGEPLPGAFRYEWVAPESGLWNDPTFYNYQDVSCRDNDRTAIEWLKAFLGVRYNTEVSATHNRTR